MSLLAADGMQASFTALVGVIRNLLKGIGV
jgi:hypothetical protein